MWMESEVRALPPGGSTGWVHADDHLSTGQDKSSGIRIQPVLSVKCSGPLELVSMSS